MIHLSVHIFKIYPGAWPAWDVWTLCHFKCNTGIDSIGLILNAMMSSSESWLNAFGIDAPSLCVCFLFFLFFCVYGWDIRRSSCTRMFSLIKALKKEKEHICVTESHISWNRGFRAQGLSRLHSRFFFFCSLRCTSPIPQSQPVFK